VNPTVVKHLSKDQLRALRAMLEEKRDALERHRRARRPPSFEAEPDPMDAATDATIEAEELGMSAHDDQLLAQIRAALARMDDGTYGLSEMSGQAIGYPRLAVVPWARLTVEEEEAIEREANVSRGMHH
jgi:DnaK suppressor protein